MEEIKISLDGNYCITGDGETARKVKRLLDDKDGVGCCKDGQIKSSSLTIQIKGEREYVVRWESFHHAKAVFANATPFPGQRTHPRWISDYSCQIHSSISEITSQNHSLSHSRARSLAAW